MKPLMLAVMWLVGIWPVAQPQAGWKEFTSSEGRFSASMPVDVKTSTLATVTSEGTLLTHTSSSTDSDLNEYLVSWTEYPETSIEQRATEKTFTRMRDALVEFKGGKVLSDSVVNKQAFPAREVTFSTAEEKVVKVRFYFVRNRFYQVMAESKKQQSRAIDEFFNSFRLLPGALV